MRRKKCLIVVSLLLTLSVQLALAKVFRCENVDGETVFSDEPCAGGASTEIKWLPKQYKTRPPEKKRLPVKTTEDADQAYAIVTMLTSTKIRLLTETVGSSRGAMVNENNELILPDGLIIDFLEVKKITVKKNVLKNALAVRFEMRDGNSDIIEISSPYPVIKGRTKIGKFSKSLEDIKSIEFFNSDKLSPGPGLDKKSGKAAAVKPEETPVIELDLSGDAGSSSGPVPAKHVAPVKELPPSNPGMSRAVAKPRIKVLPVNRHDEITGAQQARRNTDKPPSLLTDEVQVILQNESLVIFDESSMRSARAGGAESAGQLVLKDNLKIGFNEMKAIRVRKTEAGNAIVLAVHLLTGEIKMENMLPPFTIISGNSGNGDRHLPLNEIQSIRFQR